MVSAVGPISRQTLANLREHLRRILAPWAAQVNLDLRDCTNCDEVRA